MPVESKAIVESGDVPSLAWRVRRRLRHGHSLRLSDHHLKALRMTFEGHGPIVLHIECDLCGRTSSEMLSDLASNPNCPSCNGVRGGAQSGHLLETVLGAFIGEASSLTETEPGRALRLAEEVLTVTEDIADAHLAIGIVLDERGERTRALEHLKRAVALAPRSGRTQHALATCLLSLERYEDARAALEACLTHQPDNFPALWKLITCYLHLGDGIAALLVLRRVIAFDPSEAFVKGREFYDEIANSYRESQPSSLSSVLTGRETPEDTERRLFPSKPTRKTVDNIEYAFDQQAAGHHEMAIFAFSVACLSVPEGHPARAILRAHMARSELLRGGHAAAFFHLLEAKKQLPCVSAIANGALAFDAHNLRGRPAQRALLRFYERLLSKRYGVQITNMYSVESQVRGATLRQTVLITADDQHLHVTRAGNVGIVQGPDGEPLDFAFPERRESFDDL